MDAPWAPEEGWNSSAETGRNVPDLVAFLALDLGGNSSPGGDDASEEELGDTGASNIEALFFRFASALRGDRAGGWAAVSEAFEPDFPSFFLLEILGLGEATVVAMDVVVAVELV